MNQLSYQTLENINYSGFLLKSGKDKILQFGEGNFLRAFADDFIDIANERAGFDAKVTIIQPIPQGLTDLINRQDGLYTLYLRGSDRGTAVNEKRLISAVRQCLNPYEDWQSVLNAARGTDLEYVISNTTEAGIAYVPGCAFSDTPPVSFPAKLTRVLYERFSAGLPGLVILSCELIDNNGKELLKCVDRYCEDWALSDDFKRWLHEDCLFCSTLVDRIVPGRIRDAAERDRLNQENGYIDELMDVGEYFGVWIIEGPAELEDRLPFKRAGLPVQVVPDVTPYKMRKVRILNGAHTGFVPGAWLAGFSIVRDCVKNDVIRSFMNQMLYEEVIPTLPLPKADVSAFAEAVQDRFLNPFVDHALLSITLNSVSKWKARNLPSLLAYTKQFGKLPPCLSTSFAALLAFYNSSIGALTQSGLCAVRPDGTAYTIQDDRNVLEFFFAHRADTVESLTNAAMANSAFWDMDLREIPGFYNETVRILKLIKAEGVIPAFQAASRCAADV